MVARTGLVAVLLGACSASSTNAPTSTSKPKTGVSTTRHATTNRSAATPPCHAPPSLPLGWTVEELTGNAPIDGGLLALSNRDLTVTVIVQSGPSDESFEPEAGATTGTVHGVTAVVEVLPTGEPPQSTVTWLEAGQLITVIDQRTPPLDAAAATAQAENVRLRQSTASLEVAGLRTAVRMGPTDGPACELILRNDTMAAVITTLQLGPDSKYDVRGLGHTEQRAVRGRVLLVGIDALDPAGKRTVTFEIPGGVVLVEGDAAELDDLVTIASAVAPSPIDDVATRFRIDITPSP